MQHGSLTSPTRPLATVAGLLPRIVVVCDGTASGDSAPRLADALSHSTSAIVRAVTWLPTTSLGALHLVGSTPIESFLDTVTHQLYRTTAMIGFWRLELLVGDRRHELARICREEEATLIIMPGSLCATAVGPPLAVLTGIPVACVSTDTQAREVVLLSAGSDDRSQCLAHCAAAAIAALHPAPSAPWQRTDTCIVVRRTPMSDERYASRSFRGCFFMRQNPVDSGGLPHKETAF